jgi:hypothetical protein
MKYQSDYIQMNESPTKQSPDQICSPATVTKRATEAANHQPLYPLGDIIKAAAAFTFARVY